GELIGRVAAPSSTAGQPPIGCGTFSRGSNPTVHGPGRTAARPPAAAVAFSGHEYRESFESAGRSGKPVPDAPPVARAVLRYGGWGRAGGLLPRGSHGKSTASSTRMATTSRSM